jgi:hypothetical protein
MIQPAPELNGAATDGGVSSEPKLATCSWQILPFFRLFSTKLIASP